MPPTWEMWGQVAPQFQGAAPGRPVQALPTRPCVLCDTRCRAPVLACRRLGYELEGHYMIKQLGPPPNRRHRTGQAAGQVQAPPAAAAAPMP